MLYFFAVLSMRSIIIRRVVRHRMATWKVRRCGQRFGPMPLHPRLFVVYPFEGSTKLESGLDYFDGFLQCEAGILQNPANKHLPFFQSKRLCCVLSFKYTQHNKPWLNNILSFVSPHTHSPSRFPRPQPFHIRRSSRGHTTPGGESQAGNLAASRVESK